MYLGMQRFAGWMVGEGEGESESESERGELLLQRRHNLINMEPWLFLLPAKIYIDTVLLLSNHRQ